MAKETYEQMVSRLCAEAGIKQNGDAYLVPSSKGTELYRVTFEGRGDSDEALWRCTCMAGQNGRTCKHLKAVVAIVNEAADEYGYE